MRRPCHTLLRWCSGPSRALTRLTQEARSLRLPFRCCALAAGACSPLTPVHTARCFSSRYTQTSPRSSPKTPDKMLMSVMGVFSKQVLNQPKDKKKRLSGSPPNVTKFSPADSVKLAADLNRIVLRLYGQFLSEVRRISAHCCFGHSGDLALPLLRRSSIDLILRRTASTSAMTVSAPAPCLKSTAPSVNSSRSSTWARCPRPRRRRCVSTSTIRCSSTPSSRSARRTAPPRA